MHQSRERENTMLNTTLPALAGIAHFVTPPLGLEPRTDFTVDTISADQGLHALIHQDGVRVRVLDASERIPEYATMEAEQYFRIVDAGSPEEVRVLVILSTTDTVITANLDAPVIVNQVTGTAQQIIHPGELACLRVPLKDLLL
jgi:flagellar assembly factor FliW